MTCLNHILFKCVTINCWLADRYCKTAEQKPALFVIKEGSVIYKIMCEELESADSAMHYKVLVL